MRKEYSVDNSYTQGATVIINGTAANINVGDMIHISGNSVNGDNAESNMLTESEWQELKEFILVRKEIFKIYDDENNKQCDQILESIKLKEPKKLKDVLEKLKETAFNAIFSAGVTAVTKKTIMMILGKIGIII